MADDPVTLLGELSDEEVGLIVNAAASNLLMFQPHNDPMVVSLVERGFLLSEPDADPEHVLLSLSDKGIIVAQLVLKMRQCPRT